MTYPSISSGEVTTRGPTGSAIAFVDQGWNFFEQKAILFSNRTLQLIDDLGFVPSVSPTEFTIEFPDISPLTGFTAPTRPVLTELTLNPISVAQAPNIALPPEPSLTAAPVFDVQSPDPITLPAQPGDLVVSDPGDAPTVSTLTLPDAPEYTLPELPEFFSITLPELPEINAFSGHDPGAAPTLPNLTGATFTEVEYTREILDEVTPAIRRALAGDSILAASIEDALFARARGRLERVNAAARQDIAEEFSGRGFAEPPGAMASRIAAEVAKGRAEAAGLNRDIAIEQYKQEIANVQFAITQGIALEQLLIQQHGAIMERALNAARLMLDTHVALFNADVNSYNAKITRFKVDAEVYAVELNALVDAYKAQVDGQRAVAEINKSLADRYEAQVRAIGNLVELYKTAVQAAEAQTRHELARIESYRASVQAYAEKVKAHEVEWNGYRSAVEAQVSSFRKYEIGVNAFVARNNSWAELERTKSARYETALKGTATLYDGYRARVQETTALLQAEQVRISAVAQDNESKARMYQADAAIEEARARANTTAFQATTEYYTARANTQLRTAEVRMQDAARILTAQVEATRGAAAALAQLAASAMSAVNFSAGVSGSGSESVGYSYSLSQSKSFSWQGETADNNSPPIY